jgi:hypothetical protein
VENEIGHLELDERAQALDFLQQYQTGERSPDSVPAEQRHAIPSTVTSDRRVAAESEEAPDRRAIPEQEVALSDQPADAGGPADLMDTARNVFVVHGRDSKLAGQFRDFLRAAGLRPLGWETLVRATGHKAPSIAEVMDRAARLAQATLILLSADDIVEPNPDMPSSSPRHEGGHAGQPRANVLIELGMALMAYPERTIVIETGHLNPIPDLAGVNALRFDGSAQAINRLLHRLELAGCPVADPGWQRWLSGDDRESGSPQQDLDDKAEQAYRKAAEAGDGSAMNNLAILLERQGRADQAEHWYRQAISIGGSTVADATFNLAGLLHRQDHPETAEQWYRKAAATGHAAAMTSLGTLLADHGHLDQAEQWYRQAAEAGDADAMLKLSALLAEQGHSDEAEHWNRKAAPNSAH